jgi:Tol biopolymer transport system component
MWLEETQGTDLYVASADGSNLIRITNTDGSEDLANWGPDAPAP